MDFVLDENTASDKLTKEKHRFKIKTMKKTCCINSEEHFSASEETSLITNCGPTRERVRNPVDGNQRLAFPFDNLL